MIEHLSWVADLARAATFYDAVLTPLGYVRVLTHEGAVGYGHSGDGDEQLALIAAADRVRPPGTGCRVVLTATSTDAVDAFHWRP